METTELRTWLENSLDPCKFEGEANFSEELIIDYKEYIKTAKNEELLCQNDFEAVLAALCCYGYGANISEGVQKVAADRKCYQKCSLCVTVCWIGKIYQSITVKKGWLLTS